MFTLLVLSFTLFGCSQRFKDINATAYEAIYGSDDVQITTSYIQDLPYSSMFAEINDQGKIFMVLAYAEANPETQVQQLKWMSSDRAMITTENSRIVQTLLLPYENLVSIENNAPNFDVSANPKSQQWQSRYDWQPDYRFGYTAEIVRSYIGSEIVTTPLTSIETKKYIETVSFPALEAEIENIYWVDSNGRVVKTIQSIGPSMTQLELTILKDFNGQ
ncbi:YjbF family lipoprotein [Vibrio sp. 99-70-13A1]|uniref:YjbF family lipoprotein n=1 Tax=Vibrio sp. 99-70-13A1 TaxID=2607601 RepID=UPI001493C16A|nr:YjbF family lipoprotein [Vibrio sp. 99-70-13A1]